MEPWVYVVIVLVAVILVVNIGLIVFQVLQSRKKSKEPERPVQDQNAEVAEKLAFLTGKLDTLQTTSSSTKTALDNLLQR